MLLSVLHFFGFQRFQNWHAYNNHSNLLLIFSNLEVGNYKVVKKVLNIVLESIDGNFLLQFNYSIQIKSAQPSRKRSYLIRISKCRLLECGGSSV